jgi:regulator of PEP synthase PpsR (kinase-PPPase family)
MHNEERRPMKVITLRNLSPALSRAIRRKADETRSSVSRTVISLLEETVGIARRQKRSVHHDLDDLSGAWTKDEVAAFDKALKTQRTIDPELWK